jgi:hypothetical protein
MYKLQKYEGEIVGVYKQDGEITLCIPMNPANTDYIAYLEWCKENTPLPAENT